MEPIILVRHGESEHHVAGLTGGWTDTPLTERGRQQINSLSVRLGEELAGVGLSLFTSDLLRAAESADTIAERLGVTAMPVPDLREFNNGMAAGMTREQAREHFTEPTEPLLDWRPYPDSETWREFYQRVANRIDRLAAENDGPVVIVTHGGTIVNVISWWLGLGMEQRERRSIAFGVDTASVSVLRTNDWRERMLERLNDTAHLYADGMYEGMSLQPRGSTSTEYTYTSGTE